MMEVGIINRGIAKVISEQGHHDLLMVCDAGFAIPKEVECVDISLKENNPTVIEVLEVMKNYFSVEKLVFADQASETNPSFIKNALNIWENKVEVDLIDHSKFKELSKTVKAVIRTGDFTAFGNVILVSGAGERWYKEKQ